jgi:hypothetical protein
MKGRKLLLGVVAAAALALPAVPASADKVKDCGTTTEPTESNGQGTPFIATTTETQTSSCNSNSDTGETTTTTVTNRGGHPK